MRLNQYLAQRTYLSRRAADEAIVAGRVTIDGHPASLGQIVDENSKVTLDNESVKPVELVYLALHKPIGYICSRQKQGNSPTLYSLLPTSFHNLKTIGRLDKDSSGLIILTNDGNFAQTAAHPKNSKLKIYQVELGQSLHATDLMHLNAGVDIEDGLSRFTAISGQSNHFEVHLSEGRNRQIRRTFAALDYEVTKLKRTTFGKLKLNGLKSGAYRLISPEEVL